MRTTARTQIKAQQVKARREEDIQQEDWDLEKVSNNEAELILCLNYEYARSYRPLLDAFERLKASFPEVREVGTLPSQPSSPRFAYYLYTRFSGYFPGTSWNGLPSDFRKARVAEFLSSNPLMFSTEACGTIPLGPFLADIQLGNIYPNLSRYEDNRYLLCQIDCARTEREIVRSFKLALQEHTKDIKERFNKIQKNQNHARGQQRNVRTLKSRIKDLGAARLLKDFDNPDYAADFTRRVRTKPLYSDDETSWRRPEGLAYDTLGRLVAMWEFAFYPANPLTTYKRDGGVFRAGEELSEAPRTGEGITQEIRIKLKNKYGARFVTPAELRRSA